MAPGPRSVPATPACRPPGVRPAPPGPHTLGPPKARPTPAAARQPAAPTPARTRRGPSEHGDPACAPDSATVLPYAANPAALAPPGGLEPPTHGLGNRRSIL